MIDIIDDDVLTVEEPIKERLEVEKLVVMITNIDSDEINEYGERLLAASHDFIS